MEKIKLLENITKLVFRYILKYAAYSFLTAAVIITITVLLVIFTTIIGDSLSFPFLKYFAFINPAFREGTFSLGIKEVMEIYSVVVFAVMALFELIKFIFKQRGIEIKVSFKRKLVYTFIFLSVIYLVAFLIEPSIRVSEGSNNSKFYFVFVIFYVITVISSMIYEVLNRFSEYFKPDFLS